MIKVYCVSAIWILCVSCRFGEGTPQSSAAEMPNGLFVTLNYHGAETKNMYRIGLATHDRAPDLGEWFKRHWIMREYFLTNIISSAEAIKLQLVLNQDLFMAAKQSKLPKSLSGQYMIRVSTGSEVYFVPIGLDKDTSRYLLQIKQALTARNSDGIDRIIRQLAWIKGLNAEE